MLNGNFICKDSATKVFMVKTSPWFQNLAILLGGCVHYLPLWTLIFSSVIWRWHPPSTGEVEVMWCLWTCLRYSRHPINATLFYFLCCFGGRGWWGEVVKKSGRLEAKKDKVFESELCCWVILGQSVILSDFNFFFHKSELDYLFDTEWAAGHKRDLQSLKAYVIVGFHHCY